MDDGLEKGEKSGDDEEFEEIARSIRARATAATGHEREVAVQLIQEDRLASWAELWETLHREKAQVQALNLDRAAFLMDVFSRLAQTASR